MLAWIMNLDFAAGAVEAAAEIDATGYGQVVVIEHANRSVQIEYQNRSVETQETS